MTVRQRLLETLRGNRADRVPLMLDGFCYVTREEVERITDPRGREIAERAYPHCAGFVNWPSHVNRYLVTPQQFIREVKREVRDGVAVITAEISTPKGTLTAITSENPITRTTWTVKYPCESRRDIDRILSLPWVLPADLKPPDRSVLPPEFDERGIFQTSVSSPFVCAAGMMPYQMFLELCATDLPLVRHLTDVCFERVMRVLDVLFGQPHVIDYLWIGGCEWLTPPMASPMLYDELVQECEARMTRRAHGAGALVHVHCHGNVRSTLERVVDRGADFFEPVEPPPDGDITFAQAKRLAAGRMTLGGNIEARIVENEDEDAVEHAVREAFAGGTDRMVLKTTANLVRDMTPAIQRNYHRLIDVWEKLSLLA